MSNSGHISKKQKMSAGVSMEELFDEYSQEFLNLVEKRAYMDHSLLNKVFFKRGQKLFVSAPTMFCKSSNMSMIHRFFAVKEDGIVEENFKHRHRYGVFEKLKIMKEDEEELTAHFCSHPVIHIDLKTPTIQNYQDAVDHWFRKIRNAFIEHKDFLERYLLDESDKAHCAAWWNANCSADVIVEAGLKCLCKCLYTAHNGKHVIILVDECDAIVTKAIILDRDLQTMKAISALMTTIFSSITKGDINDFLQDDAAEAEFSRDTIVQFYGLHEVHFDELLSKLKDSLSLTDEDIETKKAEISHLLNGYSTTVGRKSIYPLYQVVRFLIRGRIEYVGNTDISPVVQIYSKASNHPDFVPSILELLGNGTVDVEKTAMMVPLDDLVNLRDDPNLRNVDTYFLLLLEVRMLTICEQSASMNKLTLKIPNQLIAYHFQYVVRASKTCFGQFNINDMRNCGRVMDELKKLFLAKDDERFSDKLLDFHQRLKSLFRGFATRPPGDKKYTENALQGLIYMAMCTATWTELSTIDNQDNRGFIDIWKIDEKLNFAVVGEIKLNLEAGTESKQGGVNKGDEKKTSIYALKEIRGEGEKKVQCLDVLEKRQIKNYFLLGLSMDSSCKPSISIATSRHQIDDKERFICVSETELTDFPHLYKTEKCEDLLKQNIP